jgi:hypothetical protein
MTCDKCGKEGIITISIWGRLCTKCLEQLQWIEREKKLNMILKSCESCGTLVDEEELTLAHFENNEKEETRECDIWICNRCKANYR